MKRHARIACVFLLAAAAVSACAADRNEYPGSVHPESLTMPVEVVLMPVGDDRDDRFEDVELARYVRDAAIRVLRKKGYSAVPRDEFSGGRVAAPRDIAGMSGSELAALGPEGAAGLLFLSVSRIQKEYTVGGEEYDVTIQGVMVDPRERVVAWRESGSGRTSLGGLMRALSPQSPAYDAIYSALQSLFRRLPKRQV